MPSPWPEKDMATLLMFTFIAILFQLHESSIRSIGTIGHHLLTTQDRTGLKFRRVNVKCPRTTNWNYLAHFDRPVKCHLQINRRESGMCFKWAKGEEGPANISSSSSIDKRMTSMEEERRRKLNPRDMFSIFRDSINLENDACRWQSPQQIPKDIGMDRNKNW